MAWESRDYYREERPSGFGGALRGHSVVTWLLAINCIVFILQAILDSGIRTRGWSPTLWGEFTVSEGVFGLQLWRWLTYQFLHADLLHILFNMIGLFFFGRMLESWWGPRRFLAFYLLCGVSGAVLFTLIVLLAPGLIMEVDAMARVGLRPGDMSIIGASGSIFGILVAAATLFPHQRVMLLFPPIPMSLRTMALVFLVIAVLTILAGAANAGGEVAHLGGAAIGFVLAKRPSLLNWADRFDPGSLRASIEQRRRQRQRQAVANEQAEVDRILDKVRDKGLHSLTRSEKKVLNRATERSRRAG